MNLWCMYRNMCVLSSEISTWMCCVSVCVCVKALRMEEDKHNKKMLVSTS